jgi:hypothetical protein
MPEITSDSFVSESTLMAWAWPGGYPLYYFNEVNGKAYCAECASLLVKSPWMDDCISHVDVNWEDGSMYCWECNTCIESAYGEDLEIVEHGYQERVGI